MADLREIRELDDYTVAGEVVHAVQENGWTLIGLLFGRPPREGELRHGLVLVKRLHSPLGEGREFATLGWARRAEGVILYSGHYDLTRGDGVADLAERAEGDW